MVGNPLKIDILDIDLLVKHVCLHLSAQEIELFHQVSMSFRAVVKNEDYGKELFAQHWEDVRETQSNGVTEEYTLKDGKKEGWYIKYWVDPSRPWITCVYKNGHLDGPYIEWLKNGELWVVCTYKDGKRDGPYTTWFENGRRSRTCTYKADKREGGYNDRLFN